MTDLEVGTAFAPSRVTVLLKAFAQLDKGREPWRVMYPLSELLLLLTCAMIADFDDIVAYGEHNLPTLRRSIMAFVRPPAAHASQLWDTRPN